jgi:hypothetical protein
LQQKAKTIVREYAVGKEAEGIGQRA